jgi:integrase
LIAPDISIFRSRSELEGYRCKYSGVHKPPTPKERDRVYSSEEIKAIWAAAETLGPEEQAYVKLLLLLAPRIGELAFMKWSHLNDHENPTLWTVPHELVKMKKSSPKRTVYKIPLPPLAQRIFKSLPKNSDFVFPTLSLRRHKVDQTFEAYTTVRRLKKAGAPADFFPHAIRHTIATWLENDSRPKSRWC